MSIEEVIKAAVMNDPEPQESQESQEDETDLEQEFQNKDKVVFEKTKRQQEQKEFLNRLFIIVESYFRHF